MKLVLVNSEKTNQSMLVKFCKKNEYGYVKELEDAKVFNKMEAENRCNNSHKMVAYKLEDIKDISEEFIGGTRYVLASDLDDLTPVFTHQ